jgi:acetolactate synthase I/II/III large subunit
MNGAECLMRTLVGSGVDLCLMNPGTSEMQFVAALDRVPGMRAVPCLFEGVCAGAADGYARMARRPAATLLHLGPGLGNALANLHNARKAGSPVVNVVGEHATRHLECDAPLSADIEGFARPVSGWVRTVRRAADVGTDAAAAVVAARTAPGQVATLIVPADFSWDPAGPVGAEVPAPRRAVPSGASVDAAARALRSGERVALLLSGSALLRGGLEAAGRIQAATGAEVFASRYGARIECGGAGFQARRLAYFPEPAEEMLAGLQRIVLVETRPPVSFFGYPGRRSYLAPEDCGFLELAGEADDGVAALEMLAEACGCGAAVAREWRRPDAAPDVWLDAPLDAAGIGAVVAAYLPEGAVVSDEMVSSAEPVTERLAKAARHDLLPVTGGSIGQGLPVALGAALACPDRKVVALEADGSAMYTPQALWTMARERLDVTVVIFANRRYGILEIELRRTGALDTGAAAARVIDIGNPVLDWVQVARGLGVEASRAATVAEFAGQFGEAMATRGPRLIEAVI